MSDRLVKVIYPKPEGEISPQPFSTYLSHNNIILLGDPGAGKTHLFNHFSQQENAAKYIARSFLNIPDDLIKNKNQIYIDALDEKRSGRSDSGTIDDIVRKLFNVRPEQLRISCRAADWLGESDFVAFQDYFEISGDCIVLHLLPLGEDESIKILLEHSIRNPKDFLEEARLRKLEGFLKNPQNLIMLANVVNAGDWPVSLDELYNKSTDLLLEETNSQHIAKQTASYSIQRLKEVAGALFAVRLISDIDGINVTGSSTNKMSPSFNNIPFCSLDELREVMNRRIFFVDPSTNTADYTHRTIAEYLAARWLAKQIHNGLPLNRLRSLIAVDGRPASELRGLHAWLPNFLNEGYEEIIESDPYGILCYGDAASLPFSYKRYLLSALARLSDSDPWFRHENNSQEIIRGLSSPDFEIEFRNILSDKNSNSTLRSIVLDALATGFPLTGLSDLIQEIFLDGQANYHERYQCLSVWLNFGDAGKQAISEAYKLLGDSSMDLRLRADVLRDVVGFKAPENEVANLINSGIQCKEDLYTGSFYWLDEFVANEEIINVLDKIKIYDSKIQIGNSDNLFDVIRVIDALLERYIKNETKINANKLLEWLKIREIMVDRFGSPSPHDLILSFQANPSVVSQLISTAIVDDDLTGNVHLFQYKLNKILLGSLNSALLLQIAIEKLHQTEEQNNWLYDLCLSLTLQIGKDEFKNFSYLFDLADRKPIYKKIRDDNCFQEIPEWRKDQSERERKFKLKNSDRKQTNTQQFLRDKNQTLNGLHLGWLEWLGNLYFGHFNFSDRRLTAYERISEELGDENLNSVIEILVGLIKSKK